MGISLAANKVKESDDAEAWLTLNLRAEGMRRVNMIMDIENS